jgi:hypothetical protein
MVGFKNGALSIFRKAEKNEPDAPTTSALALHFSASVQRRAPPVQPATVIPPVTAVPPAKVVFAFDATASREPAWSMAVPLTDALLAALPGKVDVALAVHGGSELHTFTPFTSNGNKLRDQAATVRCRAGHTRLLDILARTLETEGVSVVIYIGDVFEESNRRGRKLADALKAHGTRLIILHDNGSPDIYGVGIFADMAARTGGAVLPFDASALPKLRELIEAVAVLAVGDVTALAARQDTMPAARLLLEHLGGKKGA